MEPSEADAQNGLADLAKDPAFADFLAKAFQDWRSAAPAAKAEPPMPRVKTVLDQKLSDPSWPDDAKIETSIVLKKRTWKELLALMEAHQGEREWRTLSGSIWQLIQNAYVNRLGREKASAKAPSQPNPGEAGGERPEPRKAPDMRDLR